MHVRSAEGRRDAPAGLAGTPSAPVEESVAVAEPLQALLPAGLRRGSLVAVGGSRSLTLAVVAEASRTGCWVAGMGWDRVGLQAAHELGIRLAHLVLMPASPDRRRFATTAAIAVDAFDLVVIWPSGAVAPADARRLSARARERRTVVIVASEPASRWSWPATPDVELRVTEATWLGLGAGHGRLQARRVVVEASGRGRFSRPRRASLWLPGPDGGLHLDHAGLDPAGLDHAGLDPAGLDPAGLDPASLDPASLDQTGRDGRAGWAERPDGSGEAVAS